ncbi:hypothetical protein J7E62_28225 [Variovorax paradoxus]|nr:hypothetical protein [Variovorax paradoxus]
MNIQALAFDTGGTVLDWHAGLVNAFHRVGRPPWHHRRLARAGQRLAAAHHEGHRRPGAA